MGALIAGLSISSFPYGSDVISKVTGVRDFFVTLFFVALGMKAVVPTGAVLGEAMMILVFVFASRLLAVVPASIALGSGAYGGLVAALNLSQISEFSLVILALGAGYGHVSPAVQAVILTAMILTSIVSPYVIGENDRLARLLLRPLARFVDARPRGAAAAEDHSRDIVLLGHFRIGQAVLYLVEEKAPELKDRITVVDYHANRGRGVLARGFHWEYGDLANPDALEHAGLDRAQLIVTTISDTFLKGTNTRRLASHLRRLSPSAVIVMTGEEREDERVLLEAGADHVLVPGELAAEKVLDYLRGA